MQWIYFDASALIKRYSQETGTPLVNEVFRLLPRSRMTCSTLGILEIVSVLVRKAERWSVDPDAIRTGHDRVQSRSDRSRGVFGRIGQRCSLAFSFGFDREAQPQCHGCGDLRSALNLQQVLRETGDELMLWTSDKRLVRATQSEGVTVFDPEEETIGHLHQLLGVSERSGSAG
jgi:predicted nucleic acid-binding protein